MKTDQDSQTNANPIPNPINTSEPTVGRMVHYNPSKSELDSRIGTGTNGAQKCAAIVTRVSDWTERSKHLNLHVFTDSQDTLWLQNVPHVSISKPGDHSWEWPEIK